MFEENIPAQFWAYCNCYKFVNFIKSAENLQVTTFKTTKLQATIPQVMKERY